MKHFHQTFSAIVFVCLVGCRTSGLGVPVPDSAAAPNSFSLKSPQGPVGQSAGEFRRVSHAEEIEQWGESGELSARLPPAVDVQAELGLPDLLEIALTNNPSLAEAAAKVNAAEGRWIQVGLPPNTVLGYSGQQLGSHGEAEQQGILLGQKWVRGQKRRLSRAIVCHEIEMAEQRLAAQQQRVITDVRLDYYEVLIAKEQVDIAQRWASIAEEGLATAEALMSAMEINQVEVIGARVERDKAQLGVRNARGRYLAAWSRLAAVLGTADLEPRPLFGDPHDIDLGMDPDAALFEILNSNPDIAARLTGIERARRVVEFARVEPIPDVTFQTVFQNDQGTGSNNLNLVVSMPIPWLDRNQGGIQQAHAELAEAEHAVERVELALRREIAGVMQQYLSAREQIETYAGGGGILDELRHSVELNRSAYSAGEVGYLPLFAAQKELVEAELLNLNAVGELWSAVVQIEGLLLRDSLQQIDR